MRDLFLLGLLYIYFHLQMIIVRYCLIVKYKIFPRVPTSTIAMYGTVTLLIAMYGTVMLPVW